jgi:DNA helicase-2/ATP-dependent DNA helicase PcrA
MTMPPYGLNEEQYDAVLAQSPVFCNASAGAGKTRCLVAKIRHLLDSGTSPESAVAVTFTNRAANEMRSRLSKIYDVDSMQISTIHSMCVKIIRTFIQYTRLKLPFTIYDEDDQLSVIKTLMKARDLAGDPYEFLEEITSAKTEDRIPESCPEIYQTYENILAKNNACDFDDLLLLARNCLRDHQDCREHFIKKWPHILVDEVQDTSRIQYEIIILLYDPARTKTLFLVGDHNQCVIKGTLIKTASGVKPVEKLNKDSFIIVGKGNSFIKEVPIKDFFTKRVTGIPVITIETASGLKLTTTLEHKHFAGFYKPADNIYFTYLMYKKNVGFRVGTTKLLVKHVTGHNCFFRYKNRLNQERADAMWFLGSFKTESEAHYYEQYYSIKYCLPTWLFRVDASHRLRYNSSLAEKLFKEVNTEKGALGLLKDLHLSYNYPHHIPRCIAPERNRNFTIYLCGSERKTVYKTKDYLSINHCYSISGSCEQDAEKLRSLGLRVRKSKDRKGYKLEGVRSNLEDIYTLAEKIKTIMDINMIEKGRFANASLPIIPAAHVLPGMACFIETNGKIIIDTVVKTKKEKYTGKVYDLNIEKYHNFIANNIVTHNSIYSWRGARPGNIQDFIRDHKATVKYLTCNYRSAPEIIAHANHFQQFGKPMISKAGLHGRVSVTEFDSRDAEALRIAEAIQKIGGDPKEIAVIYRINARSLLFEQTFTRLRIPYRLVGDCPFYQRKCIKDLLAALKAANNPQDIESLVRVINTPKRGFGETKQEQLLLHGRQYLDTLDMPQIKAFLSLLEALRGMDPSLALTEYLNRSGYLQTLTKDSDRYMVDALRDMVANYGSMDELILASTFIERDSKEGVNLITAHASKGLEFDRVFVVGVEQGLWPHQNAEDIREEERLYYTACTRARRALNISYCKSRNYRGTLLQVPPSPLFIKSYNYLNSAPAS